VEQGQESGHAPEAGRELEHLSVETSSLTHPDYFPYFNELAGSDPSRILIDSNLDWGQDVLRLEKILNQEKTDRVGLSLMGAHDFDALGFPPHYNAHPWVPTRGFVAVGDHSYRMRRAEGGWRWLARRPYRRIGTSIRLYEIP
jgi:hypothetical protein